MRAIGGGSKSSTWTQLKADVMGKKIITLNVKEAGCLGVAILARSTDTGESVHELAAKWVQPISIVYPQAENQKWYDEKFKLYRKLYDTVKEIPL